MVDASDDASDETLMVRYQRGDDGAFRELTGRHSVRLFNFLLRMLRDPSAAEELTQEVFYRVVKHATSFKHESRFTTWLYTIARNLCVDHTRRQKHHRHHPVNEMTVNETESAEQAGHAHDRTPYGTSAAPPSSATTLDTERATGAGELDEAIVATVNELPDEQREVFLLRELAGLPFREIADATGASENTVKSRMRHALERLQSALSSFEAYARELR